MWYWFGQVIEGFQVDGFDGVVVVGVGGQYDVGDGGDGWGVLQEDQVVFFGYVQIDDGGIDCMCGQQGQVGGGIVGFQDFVVEVVDGFGQVVVKGSIVIDDQDVCYGNFILKWVLCLFVVRWMMLLCVCMILCISIRFRLVLLVCWLMKGLNRLLCNFVGMFGLLLVIYSSSCLFLCKCVFNVMWLFVV